MFRVFVPEDKGKSFTLWAYFTHRKVNWIILKCIKMHVLMLMSILAFHFKWQFRLSILYIICTWNNVQRYTVSVKLLSGHYICLAPQSCFVFLCLIKFTVFMLHHNGHTSLWKIHFLLQITNTANYIYSHNIGLHNIRQITEKNFLKSRFQLRLWKASESDHVFSSKRVIL